MTTATARSAQGAAPESGQGSGAGADLLSGSGAGSVQGRGIMVTTPQLPDLVGLAAHWLADTLALADGAAVASWPDASSEHVDVAQAVSGKRPLFKTGQINGLPAVLFDGVDDYLESGAPSAGFDAIKTNRALFALVKFRSTTNTLQNLLTYGDYLVILREASRKYRMSEYTDAWKHTQSTTGVLLNDVWYLLEAHKDATTGDTVILANAVSVGTLAGDLGDAFVLPGTVTQVGGSSAADTEVDGYLAEMVVYNVVKDATARTTIRNYFVSKYGLTL